MILKKILPYLITLFLFIGILYYITPIGRFLIRREASAVLFIKNIYHAQDFAKQYNAIAEENKKIISQLAVLKNVEKESIFLKKRLDIASEEKKPKQHLILASVIARNKAFGGNTILIDKGTQYTLKGGESVIAPPNFLIGTIDKVFQRRSIVKLMSDKDFEAKAKTIDEVKGTVRGNIGGDILFEDILQSAPLKKGDIVITDIQQQTIPPNILIGKVIEIISQKTDISKQARIEAFFDADTLEHVFIVLE